MRVLNVGSGDSTEGTDFLDLYPSRKEVKKYNADVDRMPYKNNTFDKIISICLFEHLRNPKLFLEECYRVLKPGGKLVLVTDNALYWAWAFNKTHRGGYDGEHGEFDWHYALYTKQHLINHMKATGFKIKKIDYENIPSSRFITKLISFFVFTDQKSPRIRLEAVK